MDYWQRVLQEYLHRGEEAYDFYYTNLQPLRQQQSFPNKCRQEPRELGCFYLGDDFPGVYFTRREVECLIELSKGKTINKAAVALDISNRTVEFYVKKMREKLNCGSKPELLEKAADYGLVIKLADALANGAE